MKQSTVMGLLITCLVLLCLCCLCVVAVGAYIFTQVPGIVIDLGMIMFGSTATTTPVVIRPTAIGQVEPPTPTPTRRPITQATAAPTRTEAPTTPRSTSTPRPPAVVSTETLFTLENAFVPPNDLPALAERLEGKDNIPATVAPPASPYEVGDKETFWVLNVDSNESFQVDTELQYATDHAYFWIEEGVDFNSNDLRDLAETFENEIYPTNREFFGSEWSPGVDGDVHLYIIYAENLGFSLAGAFASSDEYHPLAAQYSNAHESFMLNASVIGLDELFTYGVLAHEFQHMIHWYRDRNETSWMNEGFSELAALLNGYYESGFDYSYILDPDIQLNTWPSDDTTPHYGMSFLFLSYFLDRFGEEATKALVADPDNGFTSIDNALTSIGAVDTLTGIPTSADDFFQDWTITSFLNDPGVGDGRYAYYAYDAAPSPSDTETIYTCPSGAKTRDVHQYGVDYIRFSCDGDYTLYFEGSIQVGLLPEDPYSGQYAFWSNQGDESDMTLTRQFDFSAVSGALTLSYWTWYDLEADYDYVFVEASRDGENWEILDTPSCTTEDPSGNSYGCGYNGLSGRSGRWIEESIDLSQYAGEFVTLRFEYITDAAVNGEGMLIDDISIPEIGYFSDFESDNGGWEAAGFVRVQNVLPQTFRLALVTLGRTPTVQYITINPDITAEIPISVGGSNGDVVLVISGVTRFTRQPAAYRFEVRP